MRVCRWLWDLAGIHGSGWMWDLGLAAGCQLHQGPSICHNIETQCAGCTPLRPLAARPLLSAAAVAYGSHEGRHGCPHGSSHEAAGLLGCSEQQQWLASAMRVADALPSPNPCR